MAFLPQDTQDVSGIPANDEMAKLELQRRLKMAQALQESQVPEGKMIGGHYVAPSWTQQLASAYGKYRGGKAEQEAIKQYGDYAKSKEDKMAEALTKLGSAFEPKTVTNTTMQAQDVPLSQGMNVPTSPFGTSDQVSQIAPKFGMDTPAPQNMTGTTTQMNPVTFTSTTQPTLSDIEKAFGQYASDVRDPKMLASILTGKYEKMLKGKEPIKLGAGDVLLDPNTNQPLYTAPNKPAVEKTPQIQQLLAYQKTLDPNSQDYKVISDAIKHETTFAPNMANMPVDLVSAQKMARLIGENKMLPPSGRALQSNFNQAVMGLVEDQYPDWKIGGTQAQIKGLKDFATGVPGNTVRSLNVAVNHLDTAKELSTALNNNDIPMFNKAANALSQATGSPTVTNFDAARNIIADEVAKGVLGNGAGALADRVEFSDKIRNSSSPAQLAGTIDTWQKLLAGQLGGLKQQFKDVGGTENEFNRKISPRTQQVLGSIISSHTPQSTQSSARSKADEILGGK